MRWKEKACILPILPAICFSITCNPKQILLRLNHHPSPRWINNAPRMPFPHPPQAIGTLRDACLCVRLPMPYNRPILHHLCLHCTNQNLTPSHLHPVLKTQKFYPCLPSPSSSSSPLPSHLPALLPCQVRDIRIKLLRLQKL